MLQAKRNQLMQFYKTHETRFHIGFFLIGFIFDYFFTGEVDDLFMLIQQLVYLIAIAVIISLEHLSVAGLYPINPENKFWKYRNLVLHFCLGTILNMYSFFFLKSASVFTSIIFVLFMLIVIVANELPRVQESGVNVKWALWTLCLFSFFSVIFPLILGFVGWLPFLIGAVATVLCLYLHVRGMMKYQPNLKELMRAFAQPGIAVVAVFVLLYMLRLVPPVPLAVQDMGIYHQLEKREGRYILSHEKPFWKFWETGDQTFKFRPGDPIFFFAKVFSPGRFSDEVVIHWLFKDPRAGWMTSDKVRMQITGGREQGFRGYSIKKNYQAGDWRVQVETTDGREIGRLYVSIEPDPGTEDRVWNQVQF